MKISLVNNLFPPVLQGGTEVVIQTTIDVLRQRGHEVNLITTHSQRSPNGWEEDLSQGFPIYRFRPRNLYYYTEGVRQPVWKKMLWHALDLADAFDEATLTAILKKEKPDVVHGHNLKGMSFTLPRVCAKLGLPYVHTIHNYQLLHPYGTFWYNQSVPVWHPTWVARFYQSLHRRMLRTVKTVISPSRLPLELHKQAGFFAQAQAHVLPSPVSIPRQRHNFIQPTLPSFVYLGALEKMKGIEILIQAALRLPAESFTLDIYGVGSLAQELKDLTRGAPHIRWLGHLTDKDVLASYDALLYPSICYETQGLSMAEALVRGTPVIASRIGSIPEMIADDVNGYLFASAQVDDLQKILERVIHEPEELRKLRKNTIQSAQAYGSDAYGPALEQIYKNATI
jgi:glycosyltransferase involved in cell wall biosynthesis